MRERRDCWPHGKRRRNVIRRLSRRKGRTPTASRGIMMVAEGTRPARRRRRVTGWGRGAGVVTADMSGDGEPMSEPIEEVYGPERAERLVAMLRALAERIQALERSGQLLERVPELQKLLGNARSELFHYEVRLTYDTPEVAESRRIVDEAAQQAREAAAEFDDDEDDDPWRRAPEQ